MQKDKSLDYRPTISIVTVTYNSAEFIEECIKSVASQIYKNVEYIIIDGDSTDGTLDIIKKYYKLGIVTKYVSEKDNGIYDAMNKGIDLATGDVIGFLNSDDKYADERVLEDVATEFMKIGADFVYGDLIYVKRNKNVPIRFWRVGDVNLRKLKYGWQICHPTFFVKTNIAKAVRYDLTYRIASDYDFILRILKQTERYAYIRRPLVMMRFGGTSTKSLRAMVLLNKENMTIMKRNGFQPSKLYFFYRFSTRLMQLLQATKLRFTGWKR
ncbi:glycosyltransferase [Fervidobacterium riparium]|uniref:glycosyltransferase family 2 protein n=1 Tax=Fervidobacterium gondwanense TaxID=44754 RepID=UPI003C72209E